MKEPFDILCPHKNIWCKQIQASGCWCSSLSLCNQGKAKTLFLWELSRLYKQDEKWYLKGAGISLLLAWAEWMAAEHFFCLLRTIRINQLDFESSRQCPLSWSLKSSCFLFRRPLWKFQVFKPKISLCKTGLIWPNFASNALSMFDKAHVCVRRWGLRGMNTRVLQDPVDIFFCFSPTVFTYLPIAEPERALALQK